MFSKLFFGQILICLFGMVILSGCNGPNHFSVDTGTLGHEGDDSPADPIVYNTSSANTNYEVTKLNNGVIIYKDHSHIKDTDGPNTGIQFGPGSIDFNH